MRMRLVPSCGLIDSTATLCAPVARSLDEAGLDLLTFYSFPKAMWQSLRTTNALENLNGEFRRRTTTQASFTTGTRRVRPVSTLTRRLRAL